MDMLPRSLYYFDGLRLVMKLRVVILCVNSWVDLPADLSKVHGLKRYLPQ
jgi:hypothetical protein